MTKIMYSTDMSGSGNEYLNFLSLGRKIVWNEFEIVIPIEIDNITAFIDNQKAQKIKFSNLSVQYKEALIYITQELLEQPTDSTIRKIVKTIERGV